jgi:hypothetical protein
MSSSSSSSSSPLPGSSRPSVEMTRRSFEAETGVGAGRQGFEPPMDGAEEVDQEREIDSIARPTADVLADMEAFQREIDELRERYGKGGGSG